MKDFSFQGKVYLGARLAGGKPGALRWVGDAPRCDVSLSTDSETRRESYSGNRLTSARLQRGSDAEVALTLNWANAENLALGLYGEVKAVAAGSVTAEALPPGLQVGDSVVLEHGGVSTLVITDSAGTPATLVAGTHYELESVNGGVVRILDVGAFTQPFNAAYAHTASQDVTMFTTKPPERYLLLDGINTLDGSPVKVRLYRVQFDPASSIPMINESFGQLELAGTALYDDEASLDEDLGGFGRIEQSVAVS
jgi:hypothetical protein